jgi:hypothetical protein
MLPVTPMPAGLAALLAVTLAAAAVLLIIWWRQQSYRWAVLLLFCLVAAPALSWWSGQAFEVSDYRAGCDGLCPGHRGAPLAVFTGQSTGGRFIPAMFALNSLIYLVILLSWTAIIRALVFRGTGEPGGRVSLAAAPGPAQARPGARAGWLRMLAILALVVPPAAIAPLILPPPEARVRGDPQRIAINARREVFMYDQLASLPVLRAGLDDVRPRRDGQPGMRVCLRTYSLFYWPTGLMYLDMAPEGVHSTNGGILPLTTSCWE